ncbi:hypothetical protein C8F01DRAFT_1161770 [Mycena amicta]|nr:hypothetical protein C8F01DRAFT_1161770 [Mycena amicta]
MKFFAILLAVAAAAVATPVVPTVSSYTTASCDDTPVDTWTGVRENAVCHAATGSALNITLGSETNCFIDLFTNGGRVRPDLASTHCCPDNCDGLHGGWLGSFTAKTECYV